MSLSPKTKQYTPFPGLPCICLYMFTPRRMALIRAGEKISLFPPILKLHIGACRVSLKKEKKRDTVEGKIKERGKKEHSASAIRETARSNPFTLPHERLISRLPRCGWLLGATGFFSPNFLFYDSTAARGPSVAAYTMPGFPKYCVNPGQILGVQRRVCS